MHDWFPRLDDMSVPDLLVIWIMDLILA